MRYDLRLQHETMQNGFAAQSSSLKNLLKASQPLEDEYSLSTFETEQKSPCALPDTKGPSHTLYCDLPSSSGRCSTAEEESHGNHRHLS
jgi:hypothetical protein